MKKVLESVGRLQSLRSPTACSDRHCLSLPDGFLPADELCCIPDYLLDATSEYREGKQYYEACLFDEAQSKFANAINCIACNDPIYMKENDFFSPLTSGIIAFMNVKCEQSMEKKPVVCSKDNSVEDVQSLSEKSRSAKNMGQLFQKQPDSWEEENYETKTQSDVQFAPQVDAKENGYPVEALLKALKDDAQPLPLGCSPKDREFLSNDVLQGVICVMLTDIAMALALCHQMKGEDREYENLYHVSNRLHSILYGPESLKPVISSGNLQRFFPKECCGKFEGGEILIQDPLPRVYFRFESMSSYSDYDIGFCDIIE